MKELKDYLHLYLGQPIRIFNDVTMEWSDWRKMAVSDLRLSLLPETKVQLSLIPVSNMSYECYKISESFNGTNKITNTRGFYSEPSLVRSFFATKHAEGTAYLLKQGIDLFGLIQEGLAIDATTLKTQNTNQL